MSAHFSFLPGRVLARSLPRSLPIGRVGICKLSSSASRISRRSKEATTGAVPGGKTCGGGTGVTEGISSEASAGLGPGAASGAPPGACRSPGQKLDSYLCPVTFANSASEYLAALAEGSTRARWSTTIIKYGCMQAMQYQQ